MKSLLPCLLLAALPATPQPKPELSQLDVSPSVFAVLAAVNAAGYETGSDPVSSNPTARQLLREHLAKQNIPSLRALSSFLRSFHKKDPTADLSQYISYALAVDGPPVFSYRYPMAALPPDASALDGFSPLLAAFYKEAHLEDLWKKAQPLFDQALEQIHEGLVQGVLQANLYLRNPTSGYLGRRFQIYVDLLGPPNQVQTRSYADDYFVVVTPAGDLPMEDVRHAYLHYLLDPLVLKFSKQLKDLRTLSDYAAAAPALEEAYKSDFTLLTTECLIKAVESRIDRKPALVDQALREGFVLTPALAEQLAIYEAQDQSFRLYFGDMVPAVNLKREMRRLDGVQFTASRPVRVIHPIAPPVEKPKELSPAEKKLAEAEQALTARDVGKAKSGYTALLQDAAAKSVHAKAYYGLARVAVLERDPELGDRLFRKVLELDPDPSTKSWSLLYLGRLADSQGDREEAQQNYKAALAVEGVPDQVRQAAEQGLKEAFTRK